MDRLVGAEINDSLDLSDQRGENQPKMHWESTPDIDNEVHSFLVFIIVIWFNKTVR